MYDICIYIHITYIYIYHITYIIYIYIMIIILYIYYMQESNPQSGPPDPWTKPLYVSDSPYGHDNSTGMTSAHLSRDT